MPLVKKLVRIGNSVGVVLDRALLKHAGIGPDDHVKLTLRDGAIYVQAHRKPVAVPRHAQE